MRDDHTASDGTGDEEELRILLRGAVEGIRPSEDALERLLYAVPARRARRRRAVVGAAAAALLAGAAIPTALHLTGGGSTSADHPAMAGHEARSGDKQGGASDPHQNGYGAHPKAGGSHGGSPDAGGATGQPDPSQGGAPAGGLTSGPAGTGTSGGPAGSTAGPGAAGTGPLPPVAAPGVPGCGAEQLGVVGYVRNPEGDGRVAGGFRITNVSSQGCSVSGRDTVSAASAPVAALGPGSGVAVVDHTAGGPGSGLLPDPSAEAPVVVLPPHKSYEVRFAWVPPGEPCTASGTTGGGTPPQTGSAGTSGTLGGGAASEPQTGAPQAPNVVEVSHTPPTTGAATTRTSIPDACGGTVYRTGAIPVDD